MINLSQIGDTGIAYDGIALSDYFIIRGVDMPLFPAVDTLGLEVDGKPGAWFSSRKIGTREITVRLALLADDKDRIASMEEWLLVSQRIATDKPHKLELGNGYWVNAIMTGNSEITRQATWSKADITFRCFDPYIYGETYEVPLKTGSNTIYVRGLCPTYPVYDVIGSDGTVTLQDEDTGKQLTVHGMVPDARLVMDMEQYRCTVRGYYKAADPSVSDFWPLNPGENHIKLTSGTGTLTYTERYL